MTVFFFCNHQMAVVAQSRIAASAVYYVLFTLDQMNVIETPWTDLFGIQNALLVRHAPYFVIGIYIYKYLEEKGEGLTPFDPPLLGLLLMSRIVDREARRRFRGALLSADLVPMANRQHDRVKYDPTTGASAGARRLPRA